MKKPSEMIIDPRTALNRRKLLSGVGAFTATLTSGIWKSSTAFGADSKAASPMHFLGIFSANGTIPAAFFPDSTAAEAPLVVKEILKPLEKYTSKMLVFNGIQYRSTVEDKLYDFKDDRSIWEVKPGGPHMKGPAAFLTGGSLLPGPFEGSGGPAGWGDRISLDQYLGQRLGQNSRFPTLEFGVRVIGQEPLTCISYSGPNQPNRPIQDPWAMYSRLFGDGAKSATELQRQIAERKSIIDLLKNDLSSLNSRLSAADKIRLDAHLTGIRSIEKQLSATAGQCKAPDMPAKYQVDDPNRFADVGRLQTDLMILAHTCGFTQISTFMWANSDSWQTYPWLGIPDEHHALSHASFDNKEECDKLIKINTWHAEQVCYLLDKLSESVGQNGTSVFDNTVLLWGNEFGAGNSHTYKDVPFVIAGGCGGYFKMGRSIKLNAEPHNNVLVSCANAMGLKDVNSFGIPGVCTGPTKNLTA